MTNQQQPMTKSEYEQRLEAVRQLDERRNAEWQATNRGYVEAMRQVAELTVELREFRNLRGVEG